MDAFLFVLEVFYHEKERFHCEAEAFQHGKYPVQHEVEVFQCEENAVAGEKDRVKEREATGNRFPR